MVKNVTEYEGEIKMKKINKLGYIAMGVILTIIVGMSTPAFAAAKDVVKQLKATFTSGGKPISLYINGVKVVKDSTGKAVTPFVVDGVTYVPLKTVADALGKDVKWDATTASVKINDIKAPWSNKDSNAKLNVMIDDKGNRHDSLDYTFTSDKDSIGEWKFYDLCPKNDFDAGYDPNNLHTGPQGWAGNSFYADGTMIEHNIDGFTGKDSTRSMLFHWTKGYTMGLSLEDDAITAYSISIINGKTFMFVELKNGDYTRFGTIGWYYVFVKTSDTPAPVPADAKLVNIKK
jgi:hypothetical protein